MLFGASPSSDEVNCTIGRQLKIFSAAVRGQSVGTATFAERFAARKSSAIWRKLPVHELSVQASTVASAIRDSAFRAGAYTKNRVANSEDDLSNFERTSSTS